MFIIGLAADGICMTGDDVRLDLHEHLDYAYWMGMKRRHEKKTYIYSLISYDVWQKVTCMPPREPSCAEVFEAQLKFITRNKLEPGVLDAT
jgi:hypothetical protein